MDFWSFITIFSSLLILSASFSGSETAFFSLDLLKKKKMAQMKDGELISKQLERPHKLLISILVGNTLVNVALASISDLYFETLWGRRGLFLSIIITTIFLLFIGEITPKILAINSKEYFALNTARFIRLFSLLTAPLVSILEAINSVFLRTFSITLSDSQQDITYEEFKTLILFGNLSQVLKTQEEMILNKLLSFSDSAVSSIKVPRTKMVCAPEDFSLEQILVLIEQSGYSRIPIYHQDLELITGVVFAKDLIPIALGVKPFQGLKNIARAVTFIPEQKNAAHLFHEMMKQKLHLVITIDEFGGVSGLITLEDLVEEIVGEIYDEWDKDDALIQPLPGEKFRVLSAFPLTDFNSYFQVQLDDGNSLTVGGFIFQIIGHLPQKGEKVYQHGLSFEIERVSGTHIISMLIKKENV
ncbi:hemolysin family protein [candidate division CSSED10-310 bacterium]|uniref:Hemolysin family protein n=1 Tax=candidate division CSSED10-310 bacterium TaxID=2855610 RepID=A0ABV6YR08_UNCC1